MQENEQMLATVIDATHAAMIGVDRDLKVRLFNASAQRMFGIDAAQAIGADVTRLVPLEDRFTTRRHLLASFQASDDGGAHPVVRRARARRADHRVFPVGITTARCRLGGQPMLVFAVQDLGPRDAIERLMLEQARDVTGPPMAVQAPIDPRRVIDEAIELVRIDADMAGVGIRTDLADLPEMHVDAARLRRLLLGLLREALAGAEAGRRIDVSAANGSSRLCIEIDYETPARRTAPAPAPAPAHEHEHEHGAIRRLANAMGGELAFTLAHAHTRFALSLPLKPPVEH
ncbi:MAG: PAS domain S-box protein [Burkholderiaceae bacterium]